jgi:hypothetical protein
MAPLHCQFRQTGESHEKDCRFPRRYPAGYRCLRFVPVLHDHDQRQILLLHGVLLRHWFCSDLQHHLQLTTLVTITLVQEGDQITIRSDAVGRDEQVLALGLQILGHLSYLEMQHPEVFTVDMPTLSAGKH